jgi:biopolymer transport protein ExbB
VIATNTVDSSTLWRALVLALLALALLAAPRTVLAAEAAWWNGDWQYRKAITFSLPVSDTPGAAPAVVLPIRLHAGNFQYFQDLQPQGTDLRFVAADGTPLKHHIESLDPVVGLMVAWVQVPVKTTAAEQTIWMYYANPHAAATPVATVYDADQVLVLHFSESHEAAPHDATTNHNDPAVSSVQLGVPGAIGNGAHFDGRSSLRLAGNPGLALTPSGGLTFSTWVKLEAGSGGVLYFQQQGDAHVEIGIADTKLYADIADGKHTRRIEGTIPVVPGEWHAVAVSIGRDVALYVDAAPAGTADSGGLPEMQGDVLLGGRGDGNDTGAIKADLDEVQISKVTRSAWWVRANVLGQSPSSTLVAYGTDESKGSSGKFAAYLAMMRNLLAQVSLDGLVVITITALMGLASLQVLLSKAAQLKRVERQDEALLAEFSERFSRDVRIVAQGGQAPAASDERYAQSGLYQMYRAGFSGLEAVISANPASRGTLRLGNEGFEAVRSALDSALVEAVNRLNARLVVMTVAIAGAPFLGLLGTVVGVMITFASIAAAGDVNVNTIAPGVAAAMTATVVGLLVAIPSLFGYNWLATRVGRRTSTMEVFADQFVSRVGLFALAAHNSAAQRGEEPTDEPEAGKCVEEIEYAA